VQFKALSEASNSSDGFANGETSTAAVNTLASENPGWIQKLQLELISSQQIRLQMHLL